MDMLHFLRPWWFLALLLLPLLWRALRADGGLQRSWARAVDAHLLPHLLAGAETPRRAPLLLVSVAWTIACVAAAGPAWERLPTPLYRNQAARVIALQLSPSMLAADLKPTRLTRARFAIRDLLDVLADGQVALLGYAGDAFVVAPMTDDGATVRNLLMELDPGVMPVAGNATGAAIRRGVELLHQSGAARGEIILVLDEASADAQGEAQAALRQGVRVSVLAVGTAAGAPVSLPQGDFWKDSAGNIVVPRVDAASLQTLARVGGGNFRVLDGSAAPDLAGLVAATGTASIDAKDSPGVDSAHWLDRGPWLALLLLPLALAGFRRGWLAVLLLACLGVQQPAYALSWSDLWQRDDQQAWQSLQAGDAAQAAAQASDADLRGAAHFRAGDAEAAAKDWSHGESADAAYNRGNALAQQQNYEAAIDAWNQALQRDPQHADALANKQAVEDWLKQQEQKQGKDKNSSSKDQQQPHGAKPDQPQQGNQNSSDSTQQSQDASAGEDGQQQDGQSGQQGEAAQQGQPGAESKGEDKSGTAGETQQRQDQASKQGQAKPGERDEAAGKSGQPSAKADASQQQAFQQAMEKALQQGKDAAGQAQPGQKDEKGEQQAVTAGTPQESAETTAEREQRQAVDQWLQRVPDDPGGLLRRKFQLEYERRQRGGQGGEQ
ncbi:Ca-activated chloride channel family protein [Tahibacter aquaticus]|uniref:Ca-activated chloride channel family protein n=1 Tax=Tahibacter aquaticus TaxID=520092 RepID=A0A4R6YTH0_9GAMM|nr:VWA domain-containing protein [Tahibacter aquaticus]TDR41697.1 Ca-activated chloride channel family protein [Tahibacter aquaticus]